MKVCEWPECFFDVEGLIQGNQFVEGGDLEYKDERNIIRHKHLSSETAEKMASKSRIGPDAKKVAKELGAALCELLIDEDDPRADALRPILYSLARGVAKDAAGAVRSIETALSLIGPNKNRPAIVVNDGELCPVCHEVKGERIVVEIDEAIIDRYGINIQE